MNEFYLLIANRWEQICEISLNYKLVNVFLDRIEGID